jgi:hypothetical protein
MNCCRCGCSATEDNWVAGFDQNKANCENCCHKSDGKDYYKVVSEDLKSAWLSVNSPTKSFAIQYEEKEWVKPIKDTQIMVFSNYISAIGWADGVFSGVWKGPYKIYKCKIIESKSKNFVMTSPANIADYLVSKIKGYNYQDLTYNTTPPQDTVFCDAICLTEKL